MADDIYINTGTTFQQQYTARVPANAQQPVSGQVPARQPANAQNPFTYANRNPFTYRSPVVNQTPYIANAQQSYPYPANSQTPFIANAQNTYPYIANDRQPAIYQHPFTYARQAQVPAIYQHPTTYARQGQTPTTYQNRQPFTYQARQPLIYRNPYPYIGQARQPSTYQHRTPSTYRSPVSNQTPFTYAYRAPFTYRTPVNNQTPYIANAQTPYIANTQQPYIANAQTPYIANATGNADRTIPDPNVEDSTLVSTWQAYEVGEAEAESRADADIKIQVGWETMPAGGRLIVLADEVGSMSPNGSGTNSTNRRIYYWTDLLVNGAGATGYTVRYTQTNITQQSSEGTFPAGSGNTIPSGGTGTTVPSIGSALKLHFNVYAECEGAGCDNMEQAKFDINLIFEHATLPTLTFTHNWHATAHADSDTNE